MANRLREYHRPRDVEDARKLLRRTEVATAPLVVGPRPPVGPPPVPGAEAVVDLSQLDLAFIREAEGTVRVGALMTLQGLAESATARSQADGILAQAALLSASRGLRQLATVGGAVLSAAGPPEVVLALLALDAAVVVEGPRAGELPLADYLASPHNLTPGDLIVEVKFASQPGPGVGGALSRVGRTPQDESIVAAAAVVEAAGGVCRRARLALAGAGSRPARAAAVERMLEGESLSEERIQAAAQVLLAEADPPSDYRGSAEYRRAMAAALARRALSSAWLSASRG